MSWPFFYLARASFWLLGVGGSQDAVRHCPNRSFRPGSFCYFGLFSFPNRLLDRLELGSIAMGSPPTYKFHGVCYSRHVVWNILSINDFWESFTWSRDFRIIRRLLDPWGFLLGPFSGFFYGNVFTVFSLDLLRLEEISATWQDIETILGWLKEKVL